MNILDSAHAVAHEYAGGCESLAPRMDVSAAVLRSKVNPNVQTHHLTLKEAVRMTAITGDTRILQAWARELGLAVVEIPNPESCADSDVIELMARSLQTHGEIGREINKTFEDGRVERHEVARVKDRVWSHMVTVLGLVGRIEGMAEPE